MIGVRFWDAIFSKSGLGYAIGGSAVVRVGFRVVKLDFRIEG